MTPAEIRAAMKATTKVMTPEQYIAVLKEPRKGEIARLDRLIRQTVPKLEPYICAGMLGYGRVRFKTGRGVEREWCKIALASNKSSMSLYTCAADKDGFVAERFRERLPKASIGKSCVRFKKVEDLDLEAVKEMLKLAEKTGFGM